MQECDLFIASSVESLNDLLKTEIARGKTVHCQFPHSQFEDPFLLRQCEKKGVSKISFSRGKDIQIHPQSRNRPPQ